MGVSSNDLTEYLSADELVRRTVPGTLIDDSYRSPGAIGITDRRLLFVSRDEGFLDVSYDAIDSIRCRPRTTVTYAGAGYRLAALLGLFVAVIGVVGVAVLDPSPLAFVLFVGVVGGAVSAEYVRRAGIGIERTAPDEIRGLRNLRPGSIDVVRRDGGRERRDDDVLLVLGIGLVALISMVGLIALTSGLVVLPLTLVVLAGLALTDAARRRVQALEETGAGRRTERDLRIHLVGGRVVRLRVDDEWPIDRELSEVARGIDPR